MSLLVFIGVIMSPGVSNGLLVNDDDFDAVTDWCTRMKTAVNGDEARRRLPLARARTWGHA